MKPHSLVLVFYRRLLRATTEGGPVYLGNPLLHYCSAPPPTGVVLPTETWRRGAWWTPRGPLPMPNTQMLSWPPVLFGNTPPFGVLSQVPSPQSHHPALHVWHNPLRQEFIVASCGLLQFHILDKKPLVRWVTLGEIGAVFHHEVFMLVNIKNWGLCGCQAVVKNA